jgi:hypothetical protein
MVFDGPLQTSGCLFGFFALMLINGKNIQYNAIMTINK